MPDGVQFGDEQGTVVRTQTSVPLLVRMHFAKNARESDMMLGVIAGLCIVLALVIAFFSFAGTGGDAGVPSPYASEADF